MKRRNEENLIKLAFGELSKDQAARLQRSIGTDPQAADTVDMYQSLRADLKLLNDIPPDQMSTERIRDAILGQGLKQRRGLSWTGWLVAPALVAALAVVFLTKRDGPISPAAGASNQASDMVAFAAQPHSDVFHPETELTDFHSVIRESVSFGKESVPASAAKVTAPPKVEAPADFKPTYQPYHHSSSVDTVASEATDVSETVQTEPTLPAVADKLPNLDDVAMVNPDADQPVVVVDQAKDRTTGAQKATEVNTSTDVVVGG